MLFLPSVLCPLSILIMLLQTPTIQATTTTTTTTAIPQTPPPKAYILPPTPSPGPAKILTTVDNIHAFAGPHLLYNNGTAYEGFYFDAVSTNASAPAALILQFYPAFLSTHSAILLNALLPDGSSFIQETIPAGILTLSTTGDGSNARAQDGAMAWFSSDDISALVVELNVPGRGLSASITMRARAPLHVACGVKEGGASYMLTPLLGWAPVVADAEARVEVVMGGRRSAFEGVGYADQVCHFSFFSLFFYLVLMWIFVCLFVWGVVGRLMLVFGGVDFQPPTSVCGSHSVVLGPRACWTLLACLVLSY